MQNGDDILDGGGGRDILEGGDGNDEIRARDGIADDVLCGPGTDTAIVDTIDLVTDCETVDASAELEPDRDGDGFATPADCDDHNAAIRPGVVDVPENGIDEDCTGGDFVILDRDGDGVGRPADCDDADPRVRPGLAEIPGNQVDEDCKDGPAAFRPIGAEITSRWSTKGKRHEGRAAGRPARARPARRSCSSRKGGGCPKPRTVRREVDKAQGRQAAPAARRAAPEAGGGRPGPRRLLRRDRRGGEVPHAQGQAAGSQDAVHAARDVQAEEVRVKSCTSLARARRRR